MANNGNGRVPRVLVVDDDPGLRQLADKQLTPRGFEVLQAADGSECIQIAAESPPDVILLDMRMPGMDGAQVLTVLSDNPHTRDIPVIFMSAWDRTEDRIRAFEGGAIDWIAKSTDPRELVARVGAAARVRQRQEQLRLSGRRDAVTRLPERRGFEESLEREVARMSRTGAPLSAMLIDVDKLSEVNTKFGLTAGDEVLRQVGAVLKGTLRTADELFRYGSDEFAVVLPNTEVSTAYLAAERCRKAVEGVETAGRATSVSIGVAQLPAGRTAEELISRAEIALFRAKESGGGCTWRADDPRRHGLGPVALSQELTDREWDVIVHLVHRRTEHEIARRLGITRGTVRSHKARIRRKLHVAPELRLTDFVRSNFKDLVHRLPSNDKS